MIEDNDNLMDELINMDNGAQTGKRYINRKQLVEIATAMRRDGDEVEDILEALKDYIVDFKNTVDRPMLLPIIQDVDDGRYGPSRKWMAPRDAGQVRQQTGGYGASMRPAEPIPVDYQRMAGAAPFMAQSMGITEQIRDMYHKYIDAFQKGDLDSAMFYKNAFNELLEMRNSMYPGMAGQMGNKEDKDDWIKQLMVALVTNNMGGEKKADTDIIDQMEKLGRVKDIFGWGGPAPGGLSENAAIAAMQVAAPEIGKLTDTVGQLVNRRQQQTKADNSQATYEEMQDREREIRANYTACPQCEAVIPKWTKQCHSCGVLFNDEFAGTPSPYGAALEKRKAAGAASAQTAGFDPGKMGMVDQNMQVPSLPMPQQQYTFVNDYEEDDTMTEQEEWFETYYPRLEEWIGQGQDPRKKIQAVWALADPHEQRQLLFIADQRGVDGLLIGLRDYVKTHPEDGESLGFLTQPHAMSFLEMMFKEVRLLANEDNMMLSKQDIWQYDRLWPAGAPAFVNPNMPLQQQQMQPQMQPQMQTQMQPQMQTQTQTQEPISQIMPGQEEMLQQMNESGMLPQGVPKIELQPPQHMQASVGESLKDKLRRKQLGLE